MSIVAAPVAAATAVKNFARMIQDLRRLGGRDNPLVNLSVNELQTLLSTASAAGSKMFWATLCVLLRVRFGGFVHDSSKRFAMTQRDCADDLEGSYKGLFVHLISRYAGNFSSVFVSDKRVKDYCQGHLIEVGMVDHIGRSILSFLRDHESLLPSIVGKEVDFPDLVKLLMPVLSRAYREGQFCLIHKGKPYSIECGLPDSEVKFSGRFVYKGSDKDLIFVAENGEFCVLVCNDAKQDVIEEVVGNSTASPIDVESKSAIDKGVTTTTATDAPVVISKQMGYRERFAAFARLQQQFIEDRKRLQANFDSCVKTANDLEAQITTENERHKKNIEDEIARHQGATAGYKLAMQQAFSELSASGKSLEDFDRQMEAVKNNS